MKVYVIVEGVPGRYVTVKNTKIEAEKLIDELIVNDKEFLNVNPEYRILEQEI